MNNLVAVGLSKILRIGIVRLKLYVPLITLLMLFCFSPSAYAATYTYFVGAYNCQFGYNFYKVSSIDLNGINKTHGLYQKILGIEYDVWSGNLEYIYVNYTVPDDGSTWEIIGSITLMHGNWNSSYGGVIYNYDIRNINQTYTTSGSYTGVSIGQAVNAANAANTSAGQAKTAADSANTAAANAASAASSANTNASNASNRAWYSGTYGGSQQSVADVSGYIAYNQLPTITNTLNSINTSITNLSGTDKTPPDPYLQTVTGARATSGNSIQVVLKITDPDDTSGFTYSLDNVNYSPVPSDKIITLPVNSPGPNIIWVWVKDPAGNLGSDAILIRKL